MKPRFHLSALALAFVFSSALVLSAQDAPQQAPEQPQEPALPVTTPAQTPSQDSGTAQPTTSGTPSAAKPQDAKPDKPSIRLIPPAEAAKPPKLPNSITTGEPINTDTLHKQRKAAKLYLKGVRLLEKHQPDAALAPLQQAAELMPDNATYIRAAELARQSTVTQLVEQSARDKSQGNGLEASRNLQRALQIDPKSASAATHLQQLAEDLGKVQPGANLPSLSLDDVATGPIVLEPSPARHSFHLHANQHQIVQEVFKAYGIDASVHDSVPNRIVRFDIESATFADAIRGLAIVSQSFYEPLDPHRVLIAKDTRENRNQFQRLQYETIYLPGLNENELKDVGQMAHNIFDIQQSVVSPSKNTITLRAPTLTLTAFNNTITQMIDGRSQVDIEVKIIQLSHFSTRETGATFFQQTGVLNAYSEINSILTQNQSAVQQIISSGLVPNDTTLQNQLTIIGILLASGQLSGSTLLSQGIAFFGGGLTTSAISPSPATLTLSLNSSDTRELDDIHLKLIDQEAGTIRTGERYPIETSSYSALAIAGASSLGVSAQTVPQIQYEDLGLTLKATPKIMRSRDIALNLDLKIEALGGTSLNDIPVLDSRQIASIATVKAGETTLMMTDLSRQESRALSGLPGAGDIPGLQDISDIERQQNVARLLILITPKIVRDATLQAKSPMLPVDRSSH